MTIADLIMLQKFCNYFSCKMYLTKSVEQFKGHRFFEFRTDNFHVHHIHGYMIISEFYASKNITKLVDINEDFPNMNLYCHHPDYIIRK